LHKSKDTWFPALENITEVDFNIKNVFLLTVSKFV